MVVIPGDLILVRGTSLISIAIQEITDSPYSHVAGCVRKNDVLEQLKKQGDEGDKHEKQ